MKILAIQNFMSQRAAGGAELLCHDIFTGLARMGHSIEVLTAGREKYEDRYQVEPLLASNPRTDRLRHLQTPLAKLRWLNVARRNYQAVRRELQKRKPDVVYIHNLEWTTLSPLSAALDDGARVVVHCHNHYYGDYWKRHRHTPSLVQRLSRTGPALERTRLIAISQEIAAPLSNGGFPGERLQVIYNGLPDDTFESDIEQSRQRKLLFVGAVSQHKGVHIALEALALLRSGGLELPLEIIGAGHSARYQAQLMTFIKRERLGRLVTYSGAMMRHDVWARMRSAEIVLVPSLCDEAFGLVAAEAMACGAVPIVSDRGALPEVVAEHGFIVAPTAQGFADAIRTVMALPGEQRDAMRRKAHEYCRKQYRLENNVKAIARMLESENPS